MALVTWLRLGSTANSGRQACNGDGKTMVASDASAADGEQDVYISGALHNGQLRNNFCSHPQSDFTNGATHIATCCNMLLKLLQLAPWPAPSLVPGLQEPREWPLISHISQSSTIVHTFALISCFLLLLLKRNVACCCTCCCTCCCRCCPALSGFVGYAPFSQERANTNPQQNSCPARQRLEKGLALAKSGRRQLQTFLQALKTFRAVGSDYRFEPQRLERLLYTDQCTTTPALHRRRLRYQKRQLRQSRFRLADRRLEQADQDLVSFPPSQPAPQGLLEGELSLLAVLAATQASIGNKPTNTDNKSTLLHGTLRGGWENPLSDAFLLISFAAPTLRSAPKMLNSEFPLKPPSPRPCESLYVRSAGVPHGETYDCQVSPACTRHAPLTHSP